MPSTSSNPVLKPVFSSYSPLVDELGLAGHLVEDHRDVAALDVVVRAEEAGVAVAAHPLVVGGGVDVLGRPEVVGDVLEDLGVGDVEVNVYVDDVGVLERGVGQDGAVLADLDALLHVLPLLGLLVLLLIGDLVGLGRQRLPVGVIPVSPHVCEQVVLEAGHDGLAGVDIAVAGRIAEAHGAGQAKAGVSIAVVGRADGIDRERDLVGAALDLVERALDGADGHRVGAGLDDALDLFAVLVGDGECELVGPGPPCRPRRWP